MLVRFVNRSQAEFHQALLIALSEHGPAPVTALSYRAEMNDSQVHSIILFLEQRKLVSKLPMTLKNRAKIPQKYSLSTRYLIAITEKGKKYLRMLEELHSFIDWNLVIETNRKRNQQEKWGK